MVDLARISAMHTEVTAWRRDFHAHPELQYDVHRTAKVVADKLRSFGLDEVVEGIGKTGVVGVIRGRQTAASRVIGLRADMDALPIHEQTNLPYASKTPGKMHACGHDGHTAMLLGAARYLAETRDFDGAVVVIFQPAEEGGAGGKAMVDDGMMDRFGIHEVYGMHNYPGMPVGEFGLRPGPLLAASDFLSIEVTGLGGHAAKPHRCVDTVVVASHIILALQSIVSRNVDPTESAVISVTTMHGGDAHNVIPQTVLLEGTVRTLDEAVRNHVEARIHEVVTHTARAFGAEAKATYTRGYPVTWNHPENTVFAADAASVVGSEEKVNREMAPSLGGEDFSYMLLERPGAFIYIGNGPSAGLHHPSYDFNDAIIPLGISYWASLVEQRLA